MTGLSPETLEFIASHSADDVRRLALGHRPEGVDMQAALVQISGLQKAEEKLPEWASVQGLLWPEHLPLEQCTCQQVAVCKSSIAAQYLEKGFRMADLTGGLGVDCFYISQHAGEVLYNDMNPQLTELAAHNLPLLGRNNLKVCNLSAEQFLESHTGEHFGLLYIDPARRSSAGRKLVSLKDCAPDITQLQRQMLAMSDIVMVKMSPMLDFKVALAELECVRQLWVISFGGECKELLAVMQDGFVGNTEILALDIASDGTQGDVLSSTFEEESTLPLPLVAEWEDLEGKFLYEPYSAQMKSGLFKTLCRKYGVRQLHPNSHLFISEEPADGFPGRSFRISSVVSSDRRSAGRLFEQYPKANITVRNFPMTADEIRSRFKVRDGGLIYLFATTVIPDRKVIIVTERV